MNGSAHIEETLVSLYLRLNGYFVSGFIVHAAHKSRTEMDVLAVRFPRQAEPEREVQSCGHIAIPPDCIDFIVGEVKGGSKIQFNPKFRNDTEAIRTVLRRFGAFDGDEIDRVSEVVPSVLEPAKIRGSATFPEFDVKLASGGQDAKLRFVLFATGQCRSTRVAYPYVFGDDLLAFVWKCFRPEQQRSRCDVRYNFELWGPQIRPDGAVLQGL